MGRYLTILEAFHGSDLTELSETRSSWAFLGLGSLQPWRGGRRLEQ